MDNFNFKQYLSEGRIHKDLNISEKKEDSKKGNKEEQKRMEGAIRDNEIHIDKLNKDKKADKKKLAKLKADEPKDVSEVQGYNDRENESLGARKGAEKGKKQSMKARRDDSYGKFGKRDAEKKGKNKINKEGVVKEDLVDFEGNDMYQEIKGDMKRYYKMDVSMDVIKDWADYYFPNRKDEDGIEYEFETSAREDFLNHLEDIKDSNASDEDKELQKQVDIQAKSSRRRTPRTRDLAMAKGLSMDDYFDSIDENARTDSENMTNSENMKDEKADLKKMKVSELKAKIKEQILAELNVTASPKTLNDIIYQLLDNGHIQPETADDLLNAISNSPSDNIYEKEEVDVDIDVEDEVDVDVEADDIEIERKGTTAKVEVGLSPEEEIIQDSLKAAMDSANALGNDKLADQIGNTITFFTREYIVGDRS